MILWFLTLNSFQVTELYKICELWTIRLCIQNSSNLYYGSIAIFTLHFTEAFIVELQTIGHIMIDAAIFLINPLEQITIKSYV